MNDAPCTCTPEPPPVWVKGICVVCWHWAHTPKFRRDLERVGEAGRVFPVAKSAPAPKCRHLGDELPSREAVELGLGSVRRYFRCAADMPMNSKKLAGYSCKCSGCGPKCAKYETTETGDET